MCSPCDRHYALRKTNVTGSQMRSALPSADCTAKEIKRPAYLVGNDQLPQAIRLQSCVEPGHVCDGRLVNSNGTDPYPSHAKCSGSQPQSGTGSERGIIDFTK